MLLSYLYTNFLEERSFAAACEVSISELEALCAGRIMPAPSYTYRANGRTSSFFDPYEDREIYHFHLKGYLRWYDSLIRLGIADEAEARTYFIARYNVARDTFFSSTLGSELCEAAPKVNVLLDAKHLTATWEHFLKGTFGVCTRDGLPETIFLKQSGVRFVETLISDREFSNDPDRLDLLRRLVNLLDGVESDFAPHEVAQSSRQRCIIDVRRRFPALNDGR